MVSQKAWKHASLTGAVAAGGLCVGKSARKGVLISRTSGNHRWTQPTNLALDEILDTRYTIIVPSGVYTAEIESLFSCRTSQARRSTAQSY